MNPATYIAIYVPIFIIFFVMLPAQRNRLKYLQYLRKRKGVNKMTNDLVKNCIGKICTISTGSFGTVYNKAEVIKVSDNWMEIKTKNRIDLVNIDFVQSIKIISDK